MPEARPPAVPVIPPAFRRLRASFRAISTVQPSFHTAVVIVAGKRLLASRDHLQTASYPLSRACRERVANDYHFRVRPKAAHCPITESACCWGVSRRSCLVPVRHSKRSFRFSTLGPPGARIGFAPFSFK